MYFNVVSVCVCDFVFKYVRICVCDFFYLENESGFRISVIVCSHFLYCLLFTFVGTSCFLLCKPERREINLEKILKS